MITSAQDSGDPDREREDAATAAARLSATVDRLSAENAGLRAELSRRGLLDLATGVLVARLETSPAEAGGHLSRLSEETGVGAEDLAADIVNGTAGAVAVAPPGGGPAPPPRPEARRTRRTATAAEARPTVGEAAATLLEGGLAPLGVTALWLWRRTDSGCLRLAGHAGVSALEAVQWQWIPPSPPASFRPPLTDGVPVWLDAGPPPGETLPGPGPRAARALLPLRLRGAPVGAALAVWPGPARLGEPVRRALMDLTEVAARVLTAAESEPPSPDPVLDDLLDAMAHPAMTLRRDPADTGREPAVEYLNRAAAEALDVPGGASGHPLGRLFPLLHTELAELSERAHEGVSVRRAARLPAAPGVRSPAPLLDVRALPLGPARTAVLWHTGSDRGTAAARAVARLQGVAPFEDSLTAGVSVWGEQAYPMFGLPREAPPVPLTELRGRVHPEDRADLAELLSALTERHEGATAVIRLLAEEGRPRHLRITAEPLLTEGALTGITGVYQDVSAEHRTEIALSATFDQLTAVTERAAVRHRLALQLQRAIVPEMPALRLLPGLTATARYRPAVQEYRVGGDWYDVLPLPDGKVLVAVGDIAGHGIESATGMVALRNALRGLAFTGRSPGRLMAWLNEVTLHTPGHPTATAVCALYDPRDRTLRWASAGHLPLLLLREGRARLLDPPRDILLGAVPDAAYRETVTRLRPGDTLLLFTDGLIERRRDTLDEGLRELLRRSEALSGYAVDEQADRLLSEAGGDTDDDTSLIAVRVDPADGP
ncbi:SpoIIE family protein phosphatase [Streptomyces sp. NPDC020141]|uniref:SpoIIE family protein phosphatase n=1 Tax=Streptomyces sp. NPDC020141 TaxID=3365065 RepID=UPI0037962B93